MGHTCGGPEEMTDESEVAQPDGSSEDKSENETKREIEQLKNRLAPFLADNPVSTVKHRKGQIEIFKPWGDESIALAVPPNASKFVEALNNIHLPERYTAIWHKDSEQLEFIYTAFNINDDDVRTRRFTFTHNNVDYICYYGSSSDRLLAIADVFKRITESITNYRNLDSFKSYVKFRETEGREEERRTRPVELGEPLSFWVEGFSRWDEDLVLSFATQLNFYMSYFDNLSPTILTHSPVIESVKALPEERYREGAFPDQIAGRQIDENLISFWNASRTGDPANRILYSFRIMEYAAFFYLEAGVRGTVRKLLARPNALANLEATSERILAAVQEMKLSDYQKFDALIKATVDPTALWKEIERNLEAFTGETVFDGGYVQDPIARVGWTESDFAVQGLGAFASTARNIRNALSHGRDQRTALVITPTTHNFVRLTPWASLFAIAAAEVMIYRDFA